MSQQCIARITEKAKELGKELTKDEVQSIYDNLITLRKNKKNIMSQADDDLLAKEAIKIFQEGKIRAARLKRNTLRNIEIRANLNKKIKDIGGNPYKALQGILLGSARDKKLDSIDAETRTIALDLQTMLIRGLEQEDLLQVAQSGAMDKQVAMAMHPKPGMTKEQIAKELPQEAIKIAEVLRKVQKYSLKRKNRAGAYISEIVNYITRQTHDPALLRDAGFDKWYNDIYPKLDKRTFDDLVPRKDGKNVEVEFLRNVYNSLVSGIHKKTDAEYTIDGLKDPVSSFTGKANLAKKLSESRVLHFVDGEAAYTYSKKYSRSNLFESVVDGLTHDGRSIGLMENLGTNPRAMFEKILDDIDAEAKKDPKLAPSSQKFRKRLLGQFSNVDNSVNAIGASQGVFYGADLATIGSGWRMIQEMALLGASVISSMTDLASKAAQLSSTTDRGFFHSFGIGMRDTLQAFKTEKEKKGYLRRTIIAAEATTGNMISRYGPDDFGPGFISKMTAVFYKLNLMRYHNHSQKSGAVAVYMFDGAEAVGQKWADVDANFKNTLKTYGISENELKLFRGLDMKGEDGNNYLYPDLAEDIPDDVLDAYIRQQKGTLNITENIRLSTKDRLRTKLGTMYVDLADSAIPTPGGRERYIMNAGLQKGTVTGEAIRTLMQLKGFPITMVTKGLTRQYYRSGFMGVMQMITGMTAMGYVAMTAKDLLRGREPKEIFSDDYMKSAKVLKMSMLQGGGMGIFGDYLFGEFNRYGQSFTQTLAGPTFGTADDLASMFSKFVRGENVAKDAVRIAINNTPFANLFYTRAAMEYMFLHGMMEHLNPGYLRRMEKRLQKDYGQEYFFPPSRFARETIIEKAID